MTEEDLRFVNGMIARYHSRDTKEHEKIRIEANLRAMGVFVEKAKQIPIKYEEYDDGA